MINVEDIKWRTYKGEAGDLHDHVLSEKDLEAMGFEKVPHANILNSMIYSIGRNRILSMGNVGTPNEMLWICEVAPDGVQINDLVCLHNYDYECRYIGRKRVEQLIECLKVSEH